MECPHFRHISKRVCVCVCSLWSSSSVSFQILMQSIICLTVWSMWERASLFHLAFEELSLVSKEVKANTNFCILLHLVFVLYSFFFLVHQLNVRLRFCTKCCLMRSLLEDSLSGTEVFAQNGQCKCWNILQIMHTHSTVYDFFFLFFFPFSVAMLIW